jgi:hypothetical protein
MARHAGFACAASISEGDINTIAETYFNNAVGAPFFFPLPQTIHVGSTEVTFDGILELRPPVFSLYPNTDNLIGIRFTLESRLGAVAAGYPPMHWGVRLTAGADIALIPIITNNRIALQINMQAVVFHPFNVEVIDGPGLPDPVLQALQSQDLADFLTACIQALPTITITPPLLATNIGYAVNAQLSFSVNLNASRIVLRPLDKALTVAVDFAGYTSGDPEALVDLTSVGGVGNTYVFTCMEGVNYEYGPYLVKKPEPATGGVAVAVNMDFLAAVVANQVSPQIHGQTIRDGVKMKSVSINHAGFQNPKTLQWEDGLAVHFTVEAKGVDISGAFYVVAYLTRADGSTEYVCSRPDHWSLMVDRTDLDVPLWLSAILVAASIFADGLMPGLAPIIIIGDIALLDGIIPGLVENIKYETQQNLQNGVGAAGFTTFWEAPLPGTTWPDYHGMLRYVSITPEGIDSAISFYNIVNEPPVAVIKPAAWSAMDKEPIPVTVSARDNLGKLLANAKVKWEVIRDDTHEIIIQETRPYNDPAGNGPLIPHHSKELYTVGSYTVRCSFLIMAGAQLGEIWPLEQTITVYDDLQREFKYITWGPHCVHFNNEGTNGQWWEKIRTSSVHRIATSARCKMLQKQAALLRMTEMPVHYFNDLPFPYKDVVHHRKGLCDYCFFGGGPDKKTPFPEEDWF